MSKSVVLSTLSEIVVKVALLARCPSPHPDLSHQEDKTNTATDMQSSYLTRNSAFVDALAVLPQ